MCVCVCVCIYILYSPNLVILPVDNNEHQRIDDVSTDRISYDIRSVETQTQTQKSFIQTKIT